MRRCIYVDELWKRFGIFPHKDNCGVCTQERGYTSCHLIEYSLSQICDAIDDTPNADVVSREQWNELYDENLKLRKELEEYRARTGDAE